MHLQVLAADVALRGEEHLDILRGGVEDGREVGGGHLRGVVGRRECRMSKGCGCGGISRSEAAKLLADGALHDSCEVWLTQRLGTNLEVEARGGDGSWIVHCINDATSNTCLAVPASSEW